MSQRVDNIADRVRSFSDEVIAYIELLSNEDWAKTCDAEQWTVGVTAHHIGAGHLRIFKMAEMITRSEALPQLAMDQINEMSNAQARKNTHCTKAEALEQLKTSSAKMVAFIRDLSDEDLDRKGSMPAFGGEVTTEQLIGYVLFESAAQHFNSIKTAVAGKISPSS